MSTMLAARPSTQFASPADHTATEPPELRACAATAYGSWWQPRLASGTPFSIDSGTS